MKRESIEEEFMNKNFMNNLRQRHLSVSTQRRMSKAIGNPRNSLLGDRRRRESALFILAKQKESSDDDESSSSSSDTIDSNFMHSKKVLRRAESQNHMNTK